MSSIPFWETDRTRIKIPHCYWCHHHLFDSKEADAGVAACSQMPVNKWKRTAIWVVSEKVMLPGVELCRNGIKLKHVHVQTCCPFLTRSQKLEIMKIINPPKTSVDPSSQNTITDLLETP